jgi:predicted amidohydrolase
VTLIAAAQLAPRIADLEYNSRLSTDAIRAAAENGARIIVLPELVTSGYVFASRREAESVAIDADHAILAGWSAEAGRADALVVGGFCELGRDGLLYNSAAICDRDGVLAVYRKCHLWDREKLMFEPGREPPAVVETALGRIGVLICYDLEFPELTRLLALEGAELIAVPTNWPLVPRPAREHPPEVTAALAAARANRVFIVCCDRVGTERGTRWTGGTSLIDEQGFLNASTRKQATAFAEFDLARARDKSLSDNNDALADRRPELYGRVAELDEAPLAR